jgi:small subunit ribosomal protein S6
MTTPPATYDLTLVLDPQAEDAARERIVAEARAAIEAQGELLRHDDWGERPLAYPIERRATGQYHLLQFHPATPELLFGLDRTLRITDGILRFRIIKLRPGVPDAPDLRTAAKRGEGEAEAAPAKRAEAEAAPAERAEAEAASAERTEAEAETAPAEPAPAPAEASEPA